METENKEQNVEDKEGSGVTSTMTTKHEQVIDEVSEDQEKFFQNIPPGYRFCPFDEELIVDYLKKKILKQTLSPNRIVEVNLYHFNPETLAEKYEKYGENEKEWYFLTPRDRKYKNGSRPNRAAGDGYWKATGADKTIKYNNQIVGYRNVLVFYRGKPPKGTKTSWIMHEFRVSDPPQIIKRDEFDMKLDEWVLCRIYKKEETNHVRSDKRKKQSIDQESDLKEKKKIILMDAGEITPFNNGIMYQESYLDYQSNTTPNHHLYQLNTPFKQGSMDCRKFIFPNDNENYRRGYAIDNYSLQHLLEMDDEEEVDLMIRQFHTRDSNNLEA